MKVTETSKPTERTFKIELTESELNTLYCSIGISCDADIQAEARKKRVDVVKGFDVYVALGVALGK